jgi:phosphatidylserine decarboxylase
MKTVLVPIHRAGWRFIASLVVVTAFLFMMVGSLGWIGVVVTAWCVYFFRDPDRVTPLGEGLIVSPADGLVLPIVGAAPPAELDMGPEPLTRISIFMNVFNVHVNRAPCGGTVKAKVYRPGRFVNASLDKASVDNERMAVRIHAPGSDGVEPADVAVVQIAGLVARRIQCHLTEGQDVRAGERIGIIRFGSRVDVYLPPGCNPLVVAGQQSVAGETVLADRGAEQPERQGEIR